MIIDKLPEHIGHAISIVTYGNENLALECNDCYEVIHDQDWSSQMNKGEFTDINNLKTLRRLVENSIIGLLDGDLNYTVTVLNTIIVNTQNCIESINKDRITK